MPSPISTLHGGTARDHKHITLAKLEQHFGMIPIDLAAQTRSIYDLPGLFFGELPPEPGVRLPIVTQTL